MSTQSKHRAVYLDGIGKPLRVSTTATAEPGADELVIKVGALAINPVDWKIQDLGGPIKDWPYVLGKDMAGEVVAIGQNVKGFKNGDRVLAYSLAQLSKRLEEGAFQEYVVVSPRTTAKIPDSVTFEQASVLPLAIATASGAIFSPLGLNLPFKTGSASQKNGTILVWGGSSSVGCVGIQLAVAAGFDIVTTCSERNFNFVKAVGARQAFDYSKPNVIDEIVSQLQKCENFMGAYDAIGERESEIQISQVLVQLGGGKIATVLDPPKDLPGNVTSTRINAGIIYTPPNEHLGKAIFQDFVPKALANGELKPKPDPEVVGHGLEALEGALEKQKVGVSAKKIVVTL